SPRKCTNLRSPKTLWPRNAIPAFDTILSYYLNRGDRLNPSKQVSDLPVANSGGMHTMYVDARQGYLLLTSLEPGENRHPRRQRASVFRSLRAALDRSDTRGNPTNHIGSRRTPWSTTGAVAPVGSASDATPTLGS